MSDIPLIIGLIIIGIWIVSGFINVPSKKEAGFSYRLAWAISIITMIILGTIVNYRIPDLGGAWLRVGILIFLISMFLGVFLSQKICNRK